RLPLEEYKRFTISLPQDLYEKFESFRKELNVSRSDAIRKAMNAYLIDEKNIPEPSTEIVGCIALVTKHEHFESTHDDETLHQEDHDHEHPHQIIHSHEYQSKPIYANVQQTDLLLINDIQHHFTDIILSTMHLHLSFEKCMEIIAVSGPFNRVTKLKEELQRLKSIVSIDYFTVDKT
ncbi:MAG: ribbon-helix-helix protein, CopG family, partial [Candidatus Lokiarchaeota archaeon]|nr:ribbon-helix-helix protein, CopG family [Candidatus Lokiarchaeota archaeon]